MIKITANRVSIGKLYPASPSIVWKLITDTTQWPRWGPTVKQVRLSERFIRNGSSGQVLTALGIWLPFVIVEFEQGVFWRWKVASIYATGHRIQLTDGGCRLWFEVPILAAPYILICQVALKRIQNLL